MTFAISLWDLGLWAAISSILLAVASEAGMFHYSRLNIVIELKRMRIVAAALGIFVVFTALLKFWLKISI